MEKSIVAQKLLSNFFNGRGAALIFRNIFISLKSAGKKKKNSSPTTLGCASSATVKTHSDAEHSAVNYFAEAVKSIDHATKNANHVDENIHALKVQNFLSKGAQA